MVVMEKRNEKERKGKVRLKSTVWDFPVFSYCTVDCLFTHPLVARRSPDWGISCDLRYVKNEKFF